MTQLAMRVATAVAEHGGRAYLVGGCVRDMLMGIEPKDMDIEVYNIQPDDLERLLSKFGKVNLVGKQFAVYKLGLLDISIPRTERLTGKGHRAFDIVPDPYISPTIAVQRRDLTVNAIMYDPLTGEIVDPTGGARDLASQTLRAVNPDTFIEDPLRVYRVMQFMARFKFNPDRSLTELCRLMVERGDLDYLPKERIFEEFTKLLVKGVQPSLGLEFARHIGVIDRYFPEMVALIGVPQEPEWHGEGDVWTHTVMTADAGAELREGAQIMKPRTFMFACLCHDFGKPYVTEIIGERVRSLGHEDAGIGPTKSFLNRMTTESGFIAQVVWLVANHLKARMMYNSYLKGSPPRRSAFVKMKREMEALGMTQKYLSALTLADNFGRVTSVVKMRDAETAMAWFLQQIRDVEVPEAKLAGPVQLVTGKDLITMGMTPGPKFKTILDQAYVYQVDNRITDKSQMLAYVATLVP